MKLGCVIMASGEGKRFGSNKMLADIYGKPLVARTIDSVPRGFDVVVSTRWPEVAQICEDKHCPCVLHDGGLRSESVRAGLSWGVERNWKGCLFLPGDQPLVSRILLRLWFVHLTSVAASIRCALRATVSLRAR